MSSDDRRQQLARIHMGKKALQEKIGLTEQEYRSLLVRASAGADGLGGLDSSAHMTAEQRNAVLAEMARLGFKDERRKARRRRWPGEPKSCDQVPMLRKVRALLADRKRQWSYAHALGKKMFHVDRVEFLKPDELHRLIAALQADANRSAH